MACRIESIVTESVISLDESASVREGARAMSRANAGYLVVTRDGEAVGMFTERDLMRRIVAEERDPDAVVLGEVCSDGLYTIGHDVTCLRAITTMQMHRCRRLLVYRGDRFLGIVSLTDLAHAVAGQDRSSNLLVNAVGALTAALAIGVIAIMLLQLPEILAFTGH